MKRPIAVLSLCFLFLNAFTQNDTISDTPFAKGRSLVYLNGSIGSQSTERESVTFDGNNILNNYIIEGRLAKVVADNLALGFIFTTEKYSSERLMEIDTEVLTIGPWMAYYFTKDSPGGVFVQSSVLYVNYYELNRFEYLTYNIEEYIKGKGYGFSLGVGYTYVILDRVGLEVSMSVRHSRVYADELQKPTKTTSGTVFNMFDVHYRFGFVVLFDKLKHE